MEQQARIGKVLQVLHFDDETKVMAEGFDTVDLYVASVEVVEETIIKALEDGHNKSEILIMLDSILSNALKLYMQDERRAS